MPASNATNRFSDRVEKYVLYRPGYPREAVRVLQNECRLAPEHIVADMAYGTGLWTRLLLENGNRVFGVEPNAEMRQAGERLLAAFHAAQDRNLTDQIRRAPQNTGNPFGIPSIVFCQAIG